MNLLKTLNTTLHYQESETILNEVTVLNVKELNKLNSSTQEHRVDIMIKRIQAEEPLEITGGENIIMDKDAPLTKKFIRVIKSKDNDDIAAFVKSGKAFTDVIQDAEGNKYQLNQLTKASYLGGAGGSNRATAVSTTQGEVLQAIGFAIAYSQKTTLKADDITTEKASSLLGTKLFVTLSIEEAMSKFQGKWIDSTVNTVNTFRKHIKGLKSPTIHHNSPWVKDLMFEYGRLNTAGGSPFKQKDKWNPADIWIVNSALAKKSIPKFDALIELNGWIEEQYDAKKVVGISLKFSPSGTQAKTYNDDNDVDDILDISIKDLMIAKTNKLFRSNSGHIMYESSNTSPLVDLLVEGGKNEMVVRTFTSGGDVSGEITGKYAAAGKLSFSEVKRIMQNISPTNAKKLKLRNDVLSMRVADKAVHKSKEDMYGYKFILDEIVKFAKIVNKDVGAAADNDEAKQAYADKAKSSPHHIVSKYQAAQLLSILKTLGKSSKAKSKDFIQQAIQYASSTSELSSVFVKVW